MNGAKRPPITLPRPRTAPTVVIPTRAGDRLRKDRAWLAAIPAAEGPVSIVSPRYEGGAP